jgi:hypothetical protein
MEGMPRLPELVALFFVCIGLALVVEGLADATPLVFFGTEQERSLVERGQGMLVVAASMLATAGGILAAFERRIAAVVVSAPGVVCLTLVHVAPDTAAAWLAFLVLAPVCFGAALGVCFGPRPRGRAGH